MKVQMTTLNTIVFLDIDGVLNNESSIGLPALGLDKRCLERLNKLLEKTGASIVITSSWRLSHSLARLQSSLSEYGLKYPERIIGATPHLPSKPRGEEIQLWLRQMDVKAFVIFDDYSDMAPFNDRFVHTTFETGLNDEHVKKAYDIIERQLKQG